MDELVLPGDPPVAVRLRRSARARRLSLRVSQLDGRVTLTMPRGCTRRAALGFARDKERWLRGHLADQVAPVVVRPGGSILFEGREIALRGVAGGRTARFDGDVITLPLTAPERSGPRLAALFKTLARDRLSGAAARHAAQLGREVTGLSLRDPRSRWGSCSTAGRLMFSWRLIMAPPEVLDYVAAHEVAHLAEMNHSPAFWAEVGALMPDYARHKAWLAQNGALLHRYRLRD